MVYLFKISFLAIAFVTLSVDFLYAHPTDEDLLLNIGTGTKLTVLKDINIRPNSTYEVYSTQRPSVWCQINLVQAKEKDRILRAGNVLTITGVTPSKNSPESVISVIYVDHSGIKNIECSTWTYLPWGKLGWRLATIGEFKKAFEGYFQVTLESEDL